MLISNAGLLEDYDLRCFSGSISKSVCHVDYLDGQTFVPSYHGAGWSISLRSWP